MKMAKMVPEELWEYRENLLRYCWLATFDLVKIREKLHEAAGLMLRKTW